MWKQKAGHPPHITNVHAGLFATGLGRKVKCTKHGFIPAQPPRVTTLGPDLTALHNIKTKWPWRQHQSVVHGEKRQMFVGGMPKFDFG